MRVSCPFILLAVFIAAQSECAPISPQSLVHLLGAHVEHPQNSVAITQEMNGDNLHLDTALHSSLARRDLSASTSSAAGLLNLLPGVSTIDSNSAVGTLPTVGALPAVGALPVAGTLPAVVIPSDGALHSLSHLPSIGSPKSKRDFGNFGGMPSFSSLGSSLPIGSGSLGNMGGLSNPLSGELPMMNSVSDLTSLPISTMSNMTQHAGGSNPIGAGLPMMSSFPGLTKRGLGNLPMIGSLPGLDSLPLVSSGTSGMSGVGSPVNAAGLSSLPVAGLTGVMGGMNLLNHGLPMMNSIPRLSSLPGLTKRGLGNLPMMSAAPFLSNLPFVNPPHGLNSGSSLPQIPALDGMTGGLPMASSLNSLPGVSSKRGLTNSFTQFGNAPLMKMPVPFIGSPNDVVSGYVSSGGV